MLSRWTLKKGQVQARFCKAALGGYNWWLQKVSHLLWCSHTIKIGQPISCLPSFASLEWQRLCRFVRQAYAEAIRRAVERRRTVMAAVGGLWIWHQKA